MSVEETIINGEVVPTEVHDSELEEAKKISEILDVPVEQVHVLSMEPNKPETLEIRTPALEEVSKPRILEAPYNLENAGDPNDGFNSDSKTGLAGYYRSVNEPDPVEQVAALVLTFQRELETLQDNLAKMFKQIGHGDEWNRIILR